MFRSNLTRALLGTLLLGAGSVRDAWANDLRITKVDGQWYQGEEPITKDTVELVVNASPATAGRRGAAAVLTLGGVLTALTGGILCAAQVPGPGIGLSAHAVIVLTTGQVITRKKAMARSYNRDLPPPGVE